MLCFVNFRPRSTDDKIFEIVSDLLKTSGDGTELHIKNIMEQCISRGFNQDEINHCLDTYEALNVIQINQTRTILTFCQISND